MILVTVGMQLGFDRLIKAMDALAPALGIEVIAQTGKGSYAPQNMTARQSIGAEEFESLAQQARLIVSHAGIGTVLTAQRCSTPIVLLPRRFEYKEHRNDHQVATVANLAGRPGIIVTMHENDLPDAVAQGLALGPAAAATLSPTTQRLHAAIARYIVGGAI